MFVPSFASSIVKLTIVAMFFLTSLACAVSEETNIEHLLLGEWVNSEADQRDSYYFLDDNQFYFKAIKFGNWEKRFYGCSGKWRVVDGWLEIAAEYVYYWVRPLEHDNDYRYQITPGAKVHFSTQESTWVKLGKVGDYYSRLMDFLDKVKVDRMTPYPAIELRMFSDWQLTGPVKFFRTGDLRKPDPVPSQELNGFIGAAQDQK